jgi:hypothetical protein
VDSKRDALFQARQQHVPLEKWERYRQISLQVREREARPTMQRYTEPKAFFMVYKQ